MIIKTFCDVLDLHNTFNFSLCFLYDSKGKCTVVVVNIKFFIFVKKNIITNKHKIARKYDLGQKFRHQYHQRVNKGSKTLSFVGKSMESSCKVCPLKDQPIKDVSYDAVVEAFLQITLILKAKANLSKSYFQEISNLHRSTKCHSNDRSMAPDCSRYGTG